MLMFRRSVVLVDIIVVFAYSDTSNQNHRWANVLLVLIQVKYEYDGVLRYTRGVHEVSGKSSYFFIHQHTELKL